MIGASCNLSEEDLRRRVAEWSQLRGRALEVTPITGGVKLTLAVQEPIDSVADLISREADCCPFYGFTLRIDGPTRDLAITAGPGGDPAVHALLGLSS
jgi:MerR family copper efflux transcriptional regulator